ncbi:class I SAM-dependent methyltransferase [Haloferula sp. BvORR071]|uniref:class I SAM-dependent methyltransferase n=1 Tax=Haloferula sp. BvORR071 TaxID=1396141 RepID=UPI000550DDBF|nr:class I SAM-dependent methyltransferase [Haloferula sp. BvORR071]
MPDEESFATNIERFTGFADQYDRFRPTPPERLAPLLIDLAEIESGGTVVDLGCGTGLSTRYWAGKVARIVGIEPTAAMRTEAQAKGGEGIFYARGFSHATGLPAASADIVTCAQSLHWMDPPSTFAEVGRILRRGGIFAACDYDWPPVTGIWEVDAAYHECDQRVRRAERELNLSLDLKFSEKSGHLERMRASGAFRWTREILLHHEDAGDAERLTGLMFSQGSVQTLLKAGISEDEIGITAFRELALRLMPGKRPWLWCSRVRVGVV